MDVRHITNIRTAIRQVMEGELGPVRVTHGVFEHGVFAEMPLHKQQTIAKGSSARHYFDVRLSVISTHVASMVSNLGNEEIDVLSVDVQCWTHKRTTLKDFERTAVLDYIAADGNDARQALKYPGALTQTLAGDTTLIPSGFMLGPGLDGTPQQSEPQEDWDNNLVRWSILGALILVVPQNEPE